MCYYTTAGWSRAASGAGPDPAAFMLTNAYLRSGYLVFHNNRIASMSGLLISTGSLVACFWVRIAIWELGQL